MSLATYRKKRNFTVTQEPSGRCPPAGAGDSFVVQKHAARRLHYDFRLEMGGVLKSWAVAKGPSLVPGEKRLAVEVEDHPLDYGDFEGTIPKGEYGGGTVILWDRGRWHPIGDAAKGFAKGQLDFELDGEKLNGRWHLVRMAHKPGEKRNNWLLIKGDDEAARPDGADILAERPESVKTGRMIDAVAGEAPGWSSKTGRIKRPKQASALPDFIEPALATLAVKAPSGTRWLHEIKFDGYRLQARLDDGKVTLLTRTGLDWTRKFGPDIPAAVAGLPAETALIDGELVVENDVGASDFSALQATLSAGRHDGFLFYAFDLLHLDGGDLRARPLMERKAALASLLAGAAERLRFSEDFAEDGSLILKHACRLSLEGIVSKLRNGPYRSGRSRDWIKSKCTARQEFVIAGYVPSTATARAVGSLVLGYHEGAALVPAGRVGTGFSAKVAADLYRRLDAIRQEASPFARRLTSDEVLKVRFVRPELVAEIEFRGWTADRHLRHAAFRGLREDKPAREVVREEASAAAAPPKPPIGVKLTHPDRLYWPGEGVTKEGLAEYYAEVWRWMAPYIVGRPLSLLRCPEGVAGQCFFQKHVWKGANKAIRLKADPKDKSGDQLLTIEDLDGLVALVQAGVLEIHPWGSSWAALERPDMMIFDLDPGDGVAWPEIVAAAIEVRDRLDAVGLKSFVKTSGGKGLHVVAPLTPDAEWPAVKAFSKGIADAMAKDDPGRYVAVVTKSKRHGRILLDYLRNGRGATAVAPYSTRARPGAAVSMPVAWDELAELAGPAAFTVANAVPRLAQLEEDPWAGFRKAAAKLPKPGRR